MKAQPPSAGKPSVWQARWQAMASRERRLVLIALLLVLAAALWQFGLAPALRVIGSAPDKQARLDQDLMLMQGLRAQAQALQGMAFIDAQFQLRTLEAAIKPLGSAADMSVRGDSVTLGLRAVPASSLSQLLALTQQSARLQVVEARLQSNAQQAWSGSLVFQLASAQGS